MVLLSSLALHLHQDMVLQIPTNLALLVNSDLLSNLAPRQDMVLLNKQALLDELRVPAQN